MGVEMPGADDAAHRVPANDFQLFYARLCLTAEITADHESLVFRPVGAHVQCAFFAFAGPGADQPVEILEIVRRAFLAAGRFCCRLHQPLAVLLDVHDHVAAEAAVVCTAFDAGGALFYGHTGGGKFERQVAYFQRRAAVAVAFSEALFEIFFNLAMYDSSTLSSLFASFFRI